MWYVNEQSPNKKLVTYLHVVQRSAQTIYDGCAVFNIYTRLHNRKEQDTSEQRLNCMTVHTKLNLYLNNLSSRSWVHTSAFLRKHPLLVISSEWRRARIHFATNKGTFLDISRPLQRALALINFVAATKTEELITSFSMHSGESFSLAFPELAPYISSQLSSYIEIRASIHYTPAYLYTHTHTQTYTHCFTDHIVGTLWARDCCTWGISQWKANEVQSFPRRFTI